MSREINYKKLLKTLDFYPFEKYVIKKVTEEPGVYIFWSKDKKVNYIGKAKNLKNRLSSYTLKNLLEKTRRLTQATNYFSVIKVASEIESLLLESNLIKETQPQFNVQAKDGKNPLYIVITNDTYPLVLTARKVDTYKKGAYYGPFPSSANVRFTLKLLRRIFPYAQHKIGKKACFYSQLGLCLPCPSYIELQGNKRQKADLKRRYKKNISYLKMFLNGNLKRVEGELEKEMKSYVQKEAFEAANSVKETLEKIRYITQPITPSQDYLLNPNMVDDIRRQETDELKEILENHYKINDLRRIECFDIAHISGSATTASMVTFIDGLPDKSLYRRFKIRQKKGADDVASMNEVARRREKNLSTWGHPDLIVVDGGEAQVNAFTRVFSKLDIPVVGLAKRHETLVIPKSEKGGFIKLRLKRGNARNLLQRIRNEAHRFARRYHHLLFSKELLAK